MDKAKIADHGGLWAIVAGVAVFAVCAALSVGHVIPNIGHAVLVPFDRLLSERGLHVIDTTKEVAGVGASVGQKVGAGVSSAKATLTPTLSLPGRGGNPQSPTSPTPDLSVRILVAATDVVQFRIVNVGGATVPAGWIFIATLPASSRYTSPQQPALAPGQGFVYAMDMDNDAASQNFQPQQPPCDVVPATQIYYGTPYPFQQSNTCTSHIQNAGAVVYPVQSAQIHGTFSIIVDPYGVSGESDRGNNVAGVGI